MNEPTKFQTGIVNVKFSERVKIVEPSNVYGCEIGNDCFIDHGVMTVNAPFILGGLAY